MPDLYDSAQAELARQKAELLEAMGPSARQGLAFLEASIARLTQQENPMSEDAVYAGLLATFEDELVILENKITRVGDHPIVQQADLDQLKGVLDTLRAKFPSYPAGDAPEPAPAIDDVPPATAEDDQAL